MQFWAEMARSSGIKPTQAVHPRSYLGNARTNKAAAETAARRDAGMLYILESNVLAVSVFDRCCKPGFQLKFFMQISTLWLSGHHAVRRCHKTPGLEK